MKKVFLFLMAFAMTAACCLTSCSKEESDKTESGASATLNDFIGTYDVTITENNIALGTLVGGGTNYNATLTVTAAEAEAMGVSFYTSGAIANFQFTTADANLAATAWFNKMKSTWGYVKDEHMILATVDTTTGTFIYQDQMAYKKAGTPASITAYYGNVKGLSLATLLTDGIKLDIVATRRNN